MCKEERGGGDVLGRGGGAVVGGGREAIQPKGLKRLNPTVSNSLMFRVTRIMR